MNEKQWAGYADKRPGPYVVLELMEYENGVYRLDGAMRWQERAADRSESRVAGAKTNVQTGHNEIKQDPLCGRLPEGFCIEVNGARMPYRSRPAAFTLELSKEQLGETVTIRFRLAGADGADRLLPVATGAYQAKLTDALFWSWWGFGPYVARLDWNGRIPEGILIRPTGRPARMFRELRLLGEIATAPYGSRQMALVRGVYWLARPFFTGKRIWLTFDKLYKGGDCGEYFYRYLAKHRPDRVKPVYVIRRDAADYKRLKAESLRPAAYRSLGQRLAYMYSSVVFGTHSGVPSFCGFNRWEVRFVQDRLSAVNTCIQHGLSVQDLTEDSRRLVNNNKRYYCASVCEVENLSRPSYDYVPGVLRLTGIPRYDGLVNRDLRQLLLAPTWRSYLAMPAVMGQERPYNPAFADSDYYRIYQELLTDQRLLETAARTGYRIVYLLHPVFQAQKRDFHPGEGARVATAMEYPYEQALTESSLMVTDYSGVQFDFAYMRKPVVYFHPDCLPPHYEGGGFSYEEQGFGEICTQTGELVELLCGYMESGCGLKASYRARQDAFFAYNDHENCRRICEDALELERSRGALK